MIRIDEERDRRLFPDEEARILATLQHLLEERVFFELARDTAMRMRECYTVDIARLCTLVRWVPKP